VSQLSPACTTAAAPATIAPATSHSHVYTTQCLNIHALGEQWIEEVTDVEVEKNDYQPDIPYMN
jgi:hypothetical protein